jgi:4-hydroxyproline epimerase
MCCHGLIGVAVTLHHLGRISLGEYRIETPVGAVTVVLHDEHTVSIENVASYCYRTNVRLTVPSIGPVYGDIAWGGNWFFLVDIPPLPLRLENVSELTRIAKKIKSSLKEQGITGVNKSEIDHIEFFSNSESENVDSRNFVLCPGGAYDRSPCGTGTSAKLACLAKKGKLQPEETWVQESVIGSTFTASYLFGDDEKIMPTISSSAYICGEATLIRQNDDPFRDGIQ